MYGLWFDSIEEAFHEHIKKEGDHWLWTGTKDVYGRLKFKGKRYQAAKVALHLYKGLPLDTELQANHIRECDIKLCVNPEHLYAGTQYDNNQDTEAKYARYR